jgi:hypothetical protein
MEVRVQGVLPKTEVRPFLTEDSRIAEACHGVANEGEEINKLRI